MSQSICNTEVEIEISDPWEFGTTHGTGPFGGRLTKVFSSEEYSGGKLAVLKLYTFLDFNGVRYKFLLAQARHTDSSVADIDDGKTVLCNISAISEKSFTATNPLISSRDDPHATGLVGSVARRKNT